MFALSLTSGDYDGNGAADLVAGVPGERISAQEDAGAFNVIYGTRSVGLTAAGARLWYQDSLDVGDASEGGDEMGHAVR